MDFKTLMTVLYEIATRVLDRVTYRNAPGVVGLVLKQDGYNVFVHWGYDNKKPIQTWHNFQELIPSVYISKERNNGSG